MLIALLLAALGPFRITLNAPATRLVVGTAPALDMEAEKGVVRVRPTSSESGYLLSPRGVERGGLEAMISGASAPDLIGTLMAMTNQQQRKPVFALERDDERAGWYRLVYCVEAPGRHIPQLRVWLAADVAADPVSVIDEPEWATKVRRAFTVIEAYETGGRIGRPPKDVAAAQEVKAMFCQLAGELLPPSIDRAAVEAAQAALDRALKPKP